MPFMNTGKDQIIELTSNQLDISRVLLGFSVSEIQNVVSGLSTPWSAYLKLYIANESGVPESYTVEVKRIASNWNEGTGNYLNNPETHAASTWVYSNTKTLETWLDFNDPDVVMSYNPSSVGGANWYNNEGSSKSVDKATENFLYVEVSDLIESLLDGIGTGLLVKFDEQIETNYNERVNIKYFSEDTNTIYKPVLEIRYDDSQYDATENIVDTLDINVTILNGFDTLSLNDNVLIKLGIKKLFTPRTYSTVYSPKHILNVTDGSYWQLRDAITGEIVISGSSESTKISCEDDVNYFTFNTKNLYKHKYYTFDIFIVVGSTIKRFTPKYTFNIDG